MQWHLIYTLKLAEKLERFCGDPFFAEYDSRKAEELTRAARQYFYSEREGLFADETSQKYFSKHAQCFAILSGMLTAEEEKTLFESMEKHPGIVKPTLYFDHYYFEAARKTGHPEIIFSELQKSWYPLLKLGFKTVCESSPLPTRSDCHAWSSHPLYHLLELED